MFGKLNDTPEPVAMPTDSPLSACGEGAGG